MHEKNYICYILAILILISVSLAGCVPSSQNFDLTATIENEICQSYWDTYVKESKTINVADLHAECVYHEDKIYAIFIHDPSLMYTMARREEIIGGITLTFNDGQPLYIYSQGRMYNLSAAFENEIIETSYLKHLKTILDRYK